MLTIGFDADDTLWENEAFFHLTQDDFVSLLKGHGDPDVIRAHLHDVQVANLEIYGYGIKSFTLSMIQTALDLTGNDLPGPVVARLLRLGQDMLRHPVHLLDHVRDVLADLRDHRLILITKGDVLDQERKVAASGLAPLFEGIEIVQDKTPQAYARVLQRHRLEPEEFLMVGNSMRSDVLPVIEIGGRGVLVPARLGWVHEHAEPPESPRFHRVDSLADLPALVRRIEGYSTGMAV
ncbi:MULTISPECIES: HAD family hydrolase [unclassified Paracoccus (in: a-proteobacteria)]|uniref:HAD family hydrolase n=1 Tax=unclassified Paracoccus (in: a-proteobacteria) TaxID=2688777 RepID=UPI0015FF2053|nr:MULTISPECIES: HAD family hydrolase [unclassified Paracoccus (in: a-proteobacteria)]MBB1492891.1 HAD family hydrolase [Paracoccus sp. MC1854]MBB1499726.1 HAD family hydrolase [Paracoccus sp. MC1862]QQO45386.1 HAD family hydrolase [Paracoccus sp. MC1862]